MNLLGARVTVEGRRVVAEWTLDQLDVPDEGALSLTVMFADEGKVLGAEFVDGKYAGATLCDVALNRTCQLARAQIGGLNPTGTAHRAWKLSVESDDFIGLSGSWTATVEHDDVTVGKIDGML